MISRQKKDSQLKKQQEIRWQSILAASKSFILKKNKKNNHNPKNYFFKAYRAVYEKRS